MATVQPVLDTLPTQMDTTHAKAKDNSQQVTINSTKVNQGARIHTNDLPTFYNSVCKK